MMRRGMRSTRRSNASKKTNRGVALNHISVPGIQTRQGLPMLNLGTALATRHLLKRQPDLLGSTVQLLR